MGAWRPIPKVVSSPTGDVLSNRAVSPSLLFIRKVSGLRHSSIITSVQTAVSKGKCDP